jgi:predicted nicotinamide N-methyase
MADTKNPPPPPLTPANAATEFVCTDDDDGKRICQLSATYFAAISSTSSAKKLMKSGAIQVNNQKVETSRRAKPEDVVVLTALQAPTTIVDSSSSLVSSVACGDDAAPVNHPDRHWKPAKHQRYPILVFPDPTGDITLQQSCQAEMEKVGLVTWHCSKLMAGWAQHESRAGSWAGKRILELGSGTGLGGIALARLGAAVTLTDMPSHIASQLLQKNVADNCGGCAHTPSVQDFLWGEEPNPPFPVDAPFDYIVACDCVYQEAMVAPLAQSIVACSAPATVTYIAWQTRRHVDESVLCSTLGELGLEVESVPADEFPHQYRMRASRFRLFRVMQMDTGAASAPPALATPAVTTPVDVFFP